MRREDKNYYYPVFFGVHRKNEGRQPAGGSVCNSRFPLPGRGGAGQNPQNPQKGCFWGFCRFWRGAILRREVCQSENFAWTAHGENLSNPRLAANSRWPARRRRGGERGWGGGQPILYGYPSAILKGQRHPPGGCIGYTTTCFHGRRRVDSPMNPPSSA